MPGSCTSQPINRRKAPRRRTRLRSGKVCTLNSLFIADCLIFDRSQQGARVRLAGRQPLPERVKFFDDELQMLHVARVVWQRDNEAGLAFLQDDNHTACRTREVAMLRGKYYALRRAS